MIQKTNEGVKEQFSPWAQDHSPDFSKAAPNKILPKTPIAKEHSAI